MTSFKRPERQSEFNPVRPPEVHSVLSEIFKAKSIPDFMPQNFGEAATWWINHQEPAHPYHDLPQKQTNRDGEVSGWTTPYHDRLRYNLWVFLGLERAEQLFIRDVWEQRKIAWRGDPMKMFVEICKQRKLYDDDPRGFIRKAVEGLDEFKNEVAA